MEEVNAQMYRNRLKGQTRHHEQTTYYRRPPASRSRRIMQNSETRDDGERRYGSTTLPQQCRTIQDDAIVSVPSEGIIQVEITRESIPGITFSRRSSSVDAQHRGCNLQIDYIHPDSSFSRSPLVPGLVVHKINNHKMIRQSPQDAQRELVNEYYPTTQIQVYGYTGKAHKPEKSTRLGLVLKDCSTAEGVFISAIKCDSIFWGAGLKAGLEVVSINKRPCPKDILKAIKRLQKTTGMLEIVAVETMRLEGEIHREQNSCEGILGRPIEDVCHLEDEGPAFPPNGEAMQERKDEPMHIISLLHIEEQPILRDFEMTDQKDQNSLINSAEDDDHLDDDSTASITTFTRRATNARYMNVPATSSSRERARSYFTRKESRYTPASDDINPLMACVDDPTICSAFLDEVTDFVREHSAMLDKAVRKLLGKERADSLLGEKECIQWRVVDVRQYSQIESMPSVVVGTVNQPTPPMIIGIASARPSSPLADRLVNKNASHVSVTVPQAMISSDDDPMWREIYASGTFYSEQGLKKDPGLIVTGLEMCFTDKAVFVAKDSKQVKGGDNVVMAVLLFADNTLLKMDKMCFS